MAQAKKKITAKTKAAPKKKPTAKTKAAPKKKPAAKKAAPKKVAAAKKPAAAKRTAAKRTARPTVEDYLRKHRGWQKDVIVELREILREGAPGATEQIKWGQPVYDWNGPFAHIKAFGSSVNLGFWRGASLPDPKGLLAGDGSRMKHVKITGTDGVHHKAFVALVRAAVRLNDELGDPTRR